MRVLFTFSIFFNSINLFGQFCSSDVFPSPLVLMADEPSGCLMCRPFYFGNTGDYSKDSIEYQTCFTTENSSWATFYREWFYHEMDITTVSCSNEQGIEVVILDSQFNVVECIEVENNSTKKIEVSNLEWNEEYHIMVDGKNGDVCEYWIRRFSPGLPDPVISPIVSSSNTSLCVGEEVCFSFTPYIELVKYEWEFPPNFELKAGGGEQDTFICLKVLDGGYEEIKVTPFGRCGGFQRQTIEPFIDKNPTFLDQIFVCPDDFPIEAYGEIFYNYGWFERRFETNDICDSFDIIRILPDSDFTYGSFQQICAEQTCVNLRDSCYPVPYEEGLIVDINSDCDTAFVLRYLKVERIFDRIDLDLCEEDIAPNDTCYTISGGCDSCISYTVHPIIVNPISITKYICEGDENDCFQVADSCYSEPGNYSFRIPRQDNCDSIIDLSIIVADSLKIRDIFCTPIGSDILVEWTDLPLADSYKVFADGDSISTVIESEYLLENVLPNSRILIRVEPQGNCTFQNTEINCSSRISNVNSNFLEKAISVYPNPSSGNVSIETDLRFERIEVYNTSGQLLQKETFPSFDILNEVSGVLFLKIWTLEGIITKRILVL